MTKPSLPELEAERDRLYAQLSMVGDFRRGSVSELPQVREAELRMRCPGSSRARAEVLVDPVGRGSQDGRAAARGGGGGEGARRGGTACAVRGGRRADRGGEREDLRGQAR